MKRIVVYAVLILAIASILMPVGIGYTKGDVSLEITAGAYDIPQFSFTINPCKYEYSGWGAATVQTTIIEKSGRSGKFDTGYGNIVSIPAWGNLTCSYKFNYLHGQTERIRIVRLAEVKSGLVIQEALVLKIQMKGGD